MPAVIRVKRRINEHPLSAFVLNSKKRRLNDGSTADTEGATCLELSALEEEGVKEISTVLKFAATIKKPDDEATKQVAHSHKEDAKEAVRRHKSVIDVVMGQKSAIDFMMDRSRDEVRQQSKENRFRIVNLSRTKGNTDTESNAKEITILDVEPELEKEKQVAVAVEEEPGTSAGNVVAPANENALPSDSDSGFVYDLYLTDDQKYEESINEMDENHMSVGVYQPELEQFSSSDSDDDDSEDTNHENHYGNDYPDESSDNEDKNNSDYDGEAYYDPYAEGFEEVHVAFENFGVDDSDTSDPPESSDDEDLPVVIVVPSNDEFEDETAPVDAAADESTDDD